MTTLNIGAAVAARDGAYRKIAWRLMPFLMLCYLCAYLDRVNVGFAKLQMMPGVLGLRAGTLDTPESFRPTLDMYTASAAHWDHMDPALPKFREAPVAQG